jgi:hypothetical protein
VPSKKINVMTTGPQQIDCLSDAWSCKKLRWIISLLHQQSAEEWLLGRRVEVTLWSDRKVLFFVCVVLGFELRTFHLWGRCFTFCAMSPALLGFSCFQVGSYFCLWQSPHPMHSWDYRHEPPCLAPEGFFFYFCNTGAWTQGLHLNHSTSPFCVKYFRDRVILQSSYDYRNELLVPSLEGFLNLILVMFAQLYELTKTHLFLFIYLFYFIIHMCIQGLGHFSPLPPPTLPPPSHPHPLNTQQKLFCPYL